MVYLPNLKAWWFSMAMLNYQRVYRLWIYHLYKPYSYCRYITYTSYSYWSYVHQLCRYCDRQLQWFLHRELWDSEVPAVLLGVFLQSDSSFIGVWWKTATKMVSFSGFFVSNDVMVMINPDKHSWPEMTRDLNDIFCGIVTQKTTEYHQ